MGSQKPVSDRVSLHVRNIGGIDDSDVEFGRGVTALTGRNATNRTSLLQAIMAALGSERVSLKRDADEGHVEMQVGDETYTRTLRRRNGTVVSDGDPYLDDPEVGDLFAFLLEMNEARQAVARGDDLHEIIMRPVDTEAIKAEIDRLQAEKRELDSELEELDSLERRLPSLEERRTGIESDLREKEEQLEQKTAEIEDYDADVAESRASQSEMEERLEELRDARGELEDVRFDVETEKDSLDALREERERIENELDELESPDEEEIADLDRRIERLRGRIGSLESLVSELQSVVSFNEEMLDGGDAELDGVLRADDEDDPVTDQLVADESTVCWTCGSEVETDQIEATVDRLRDLRQSKLSERRELNDELDELQTEKRDLEGDRERRRELERRLESIEEEIDDRESTIDRLTDRREGLREEIEDLEAEVDDLESDEYGEILDLHREANQLEFEIDRRRDELASVEEEIESVESQLDQRDQLQAQREEIQAELEELRTRIDRIEQQTVDEFNRHMEAVTAELEYENIERIWIERTEREVREGRRKVQKRSFDLHIVRRTADGTTYEDTIDHLSESEREVTGLIFALAGYLAHDVADQLPFILLDSLEAIDSDRIATLIDYMTDHTEYLIVALLPEDAAAVDEEYARVTNI